jgi:16S rRNA (cytosine967-C5)-methyltransferase
MVARKRGDTVKNKPFNRHTKVKKLDGSRVLAARILVSVSKEGCSLDSAIKNNLPIELSRKDAAFVQQLCYGSLRNWIRLQALVNSCIERPLKSKDADINALLILGLYQLVHMRVPDHAALSETVDAVVSLKKAWAKKLVNGVLRTLQRTYTQKLDDLEANSTAYYNHPDWMLERIQQQWPQAWQAILEANDQHPPLVLRVNSSRITVTECLERLQAEGIEAQAMPYVASAIRLNKALDITELSLFKQGLVSVQDAAAQLAAPMLDLQPGERVLDMCAAPGGKTGHLLECQNELQQLVAVEIDPVRCERIQENLARLAYQATVITADATEVDSWWDNKLFDKILLDIPCSASGVIRRHPDIKLLRTEQDVDQLQHIQQEILAKIWPLLRPGGMLLYVTCSIFNEENEDQNKGFLSCHDDAVATTEQSEWGLSTGSGIQILPGMHDTDGFYFARLEKVESSV